MKREKRTVLVDGRPVEFDVLVCPPGPSGVHQMVRPMGRPFLLGPDGSGRVAAAGGWVRPPPELEEAP